MRKNKTHTRRNRKKQKHTRRNRKINGGDDTIVNYIISSHGVILERTTPYIIPDNVQINFYCDQGEELRCSEESPYEICAGNSPLTYAHTQRIDPCQILNGGLATLLDYKIIPDETFGEIHVCNSDNKPILSTVKWKKTLSKQIIEIKDHAKYIYPNKKIIIHCLFCRSYENNN